MNLATVISFHNCIVLLLLLQTDDQSLKVNASYTTLILCNSEGTSPPPHYRVVSYPSIIIAKSFMYTPITISEMTLWVVDASNLHAKLLGTCNN